MSQQTIAINLVGNSNSLTTALRKSSMAWKSLEMDMQNVMSNQMRYVGGLDRFIGKNGQVIGGLGTLKAMLERVKEEKRQVAASVEALSQEFNQEEMEILGLSGAMNKLNGGLKSMHGSSGTAQFAVTSLGQTFADSGQFGMGFAQGIRAINNNVQMTAQAMMMAADANDGWVNGLKAMGKSMMGPGGVLLAFFAVTAAIEFWTAKTQRANKEANAAAEAFAGMFSVMEQGEAVNISSASRLRDLQEGYRLLAEEQRKVKSENAEVVSSMLVGGANQAISFNEVGQAASLAAEEYDKFADAMGDSIKQAEDNERAFKMLEERIGTNERRTEDLIVSGVELAKTLVDLKTPMSDEVKAIEAGTRALQQQIDTLNLLNEIKETHIGATASRLKDESLELEEVLAEIGTADWLPDIELDLGEALVTPISDMADRMREVRLDLSSELNAIGTAEWLPDADLDLGNKLTTEADVVDRAAERLRTALGKKIGNAAAGFVTSMASAEGGFDSFGDKLRASMGALMQDLGKAMISFAMSGIAIKKFIKNPYLAFAAGTALVALGSRLSKSAQSKVNSATGGGGGGGFSAPAFTRPGVSYGVPIGAGGSFSPSAVYSGNSASQVSGRFVVQGRDLVAAVKNETDFQSSMGMGNNLVIGG